MRRNKNEIRCPHLIICEGADACYFMIAFLEQVNEKIFNNSFQVFDFGGNQNLSNFLLNLPNYPGYEMVKSVLIVRDAETDHMGAVQSIGAALHKRGFPVPKAANCLSHADSTSQTHSVQPITGFSLFPTLSSQTENGTLEDLILSNLAEDEAATTLDEVNGFLSALQKKGYAFKWPHKTKLHTYFSITNFVAKTIGDATKSGAFNFECTPMKNFTHLLQEIYDYPSEQVSQ